MDDTEETESELTPLQNEAHAWIRRMVSGKATEADAAMLRRWCGQSPAHATAFSEASQFWDAFGAAGQSLLDDQKAATTARRFTHRPMVIGRRALIGGALAASTAGLLVARPPLGLWPSLSELAADYRTGIGERRQVVVSDGVAIQMNTRTSISIHVDGDRSAIELIAGEASFTTSGRQFKPVSVIAAGGKASADSARFDMRRLASGACVTCLADEVRVEHRDRIVTLGPRQRVTYDGGGLGKIVSIDPAVVAAWQNGLLIFNMTPLADVIEELNRYRAGRIILLNQTVAQSPVNGRFRIDQPDEALTQIKRAFGVQSRALPGGFVLLS
jgi:transmembrane sensor